MTLRFSGEGPLFPAALIDAMLSGDVVFLCGTGISAPQLPTFQQLVDTVSGDLGEPLNASETLAYDEKRYEEVLGSIGRRMADPRAMARAASAALAVPAAPQLDQHKTVLRLSRDLGNRVLTVTTNFDTLLERAMLDADPAADVEAASFAGQALPAPGGAAFSGIIHLHGRLADAQLSLEATPLVLTSADYGDAYMRGGWASRFLFDLARCMTIVLLGYSAGDAPVRYFLNVLEADRERFPDLKPVYAFAPYTNDPEEAEKPWGTVAVTPIPYCEINPETLARDHAPLWRDLAALADLVERPNAHRAGRLSAILSRPAATLTDPLLAELRWLAAGGTDPWKIAVETIEDPSWFTVFEDNSLWNRNQAEWTVATWVARNFADRTRFLTAVDWQNRLGNTFTQRLSVRLDQAQPVDPVWRKAWRQFAYIRTPDSFALEDHLFALKGRLKSGLVLEEDIRSAVAALTPVLRLDRPFRGLDAEEDAADTIDAEPPARLADLARVDFGRDYRDEVPELIETLIGIHDHAPRVLACATTALIGSVAQAVGLDRIQGDADDSDFTVPSVEEHPQNTLHGGVQPLVRVIVGAFALAAAANRAETRRIAALWLDMPGRIGARLTLHAMRNPAAFDADEAMGYLLELDNTRFWVIRREIAKLLADRAGAADGALVTAVEQRIRETGDDYFARYPVEEGQPDWRARARDNEVWLRLSALEQAGVLSADGAAALAAIRQRRPYLDRPVQDRDFFSTYASGVRRVVGDIAPITSAAPQDRLEIVQRQVESSDIEQRQGWSTYCRTDPRGAYETLAGAALTPVNLDLWDTLLSAISTGDETSKAVRDEIAVEAVAKLAALSADELGPVTGSVVDIFLFGPRAQLADRETWYDRLWESLGGDTREAAEHADLASAVMNDPVGRLVRVLLLELEAGVAAESAEIALQRERLARIAAAPHRPGFYARVALIQHMAFLQRVASTLVEAHLLPRLDDDAEGPGLRAVFITYAAITPELTQTIPAIILKAIREARPGIDNALQVAAVLLRPALAELRGDAEPEWGISAADIRQLLRVVTGAVRKAVLDVLDAVMGRRFKSSQVGWLSLRMMVLETGSE